MLNAEGHSKRRWVELEGQFPRSLGFGLAAGDSSYSRLLSSDQSCLGLRSEVLEGGSAIVGISDAFC